MAIFLSIKSYFQSITDTIELKPMRKKSEYMKIVKLLIAIILLFSIVGCDKTPDPIPPLTCGDNEKEESGVCVIADQDLEDMRISLGKTIELSNYQLDVLVKYSKEAIEYSYDMILSFDDNLSLFKLNDETIYYQLEGNKVNQYTKQGNSYLLEVVETGQGYGFYQLLQPKWFTKFDTYYLLESKYLGEITKIIQSDFPDGEVKRFEVELGETYLNHFMFELLLNEQLYQLTFTFSLMDQVSLELPLG